MKTCPVCHARCFDDMDMCYGCLHRFSGEDSLQCDDNGLDSIADEIAEPAFLPKAVEAESSQMPASPLTGVCDRQILNDTAAKGLDERSCMVAPESFPDNETLVMTIEVPTSWIRMLASRSAAKTSQAQR